MSKRQKILILGNGQIGSALAELYGDGATQLTRADIDFATASQKDFYKICAAHQPDVIINTIAYTKVDQAEKERELAKLVNSDVLALLAAAAKEYNALLVHYSTDYVFNGNGDKAWQESDPTQPINHYGATKLWGEKVTEASGCKHLIFRVSWVYDADHHNFLNTMLRLASEKEELSIVDDQIGAPCYACGIASATKQVLDALDSNVPSGVYHMCYGGETSWKNFAEAIFAAAKEHGQTFTLQNIKATTTASYPTPALRPQNSRLDCSKLKETFGVTLPDWKEGLTACLKVKYES